LSTAINSDRFSSKIIARHDRQCNKLGLHPEVPYVILSCGEDGVVKNIDIRESLLLDNMKITK
jgi:WD repeat-containing protein 42A